MERERGYGGEFLLPGQELLGWKGVVEGAGRRGIRIGALGWEGPGFWNACWLFWRFPPRRSRASCSSFCRWVLA